MSGSEQLNAHFLRHVKTGMYVQPEGGNAANGVRLVLNPGPHNSSPNLLFDLRSDGSIVHVVSGLAVHPMKVSLGAELVLLPDSTDSRCAFVRDEAGGFFYHRDSRMHVHPSQGKGKPGARLMLHPDGPEKAFAGELEYALEADYQVLGILRLAVALMQVCSLKPIRAFPSYCPSVQARDKALTFLTLPFFFAVGRAWN